MKSIVLSVVLVMVFLLATLSCSIRQEAFLEVDGSGSVSFKFKVEPFFLNTVQELASLEGGKAEENKEWKLFDVEKIREDFAKKSTFRLTSLSSPSPDTLEGSFTFQDVEQVFRGEVELTKAGIISYNRTEGKNTIKVHLDRENFKQITSFLPVRENPLFQMFGPEENEDTTQQEYLDMMEFVFGDKGPPGVKASTIELKVRVKGRVLSQSGGEMVDGGVLFKIPLMRVLLLAKPLDYSIVFH